MKKYKKIISIAVAVMMCFCMAACSKEEFDAKGYVQSALDAVYHGEYERYAEFTGLSVEEAKKQQDEEFQEVMKQQFTGEEGFSEEQIASYADKMREAYTLAKYEVLEATKDEDDNYTVKVKAEPSDVFKTMEENFTKVAEEKGAQGQDIQSPEVMISILNEGVQRSIDNNTYGEATTIEVKVEKDDSGAYGLSEAEMNNLESALFVFE